MLEDKNQQLQRQVESLYQTIFAEQKDKETTNEQKEKVYLTYQKSLEETMKMKEKVKKLTTQQQRLQDKILQISIGNGMKQNDKETIMILLLGIVKQLNGLKMHRDGIKQTVSQIEDQERREEVEEILRDFRIIK